jgi:hypothetical protein
VNQLKPGGEGRSWSSDWLLADNGPRQAVVPRNSLARSKALLQHSGSAVNPYYNLPPEQRATQRLVEKFNADERLWRKLEPRRRARRKLRPRILRKKLRQSDLLEFTKAKPPQDCIGQWVKP